MIKELEKAVITFKLHSLWLLIVFAFFATTNVQAQYATESELKEAAEKFFDASNYAEALPLYSQLLSNYPKDPNYNYRFGACLLFADKDKEKSLQFLKQAVAKPEVDVEAFYFMGKAFHINYEFDKAVENYEKFKAKAKGKLVQKYNVEHELKMAKSGKNLLSIITDIIVLDKKTLNESDFFRSYKLEGIGGKIIVKPEEFMSDFEKKNNIQSVMYLPDGDGRVYFSRIDDKSNPQSDIYFADRKLDGSFTQAVKLDNVINTPFDEAFPFMHPDGVTLYFSSKGHNSMGGYDIFRSFYDPIAKSWSEPVNLDFAINTPNDDYFMITDKDQKRAYFASNRFLEAGKANVYHIEMERIPLDVTVVAGTFTAPYTKSATIKVQNLFDNSIVGSVKTNKDGSYQLEIPIVGKFRFLVDADGSPVTHAGTVELKEADALNGISQQMEITGSGDAEKLTIKNLMGEDVKPQDVPLSVDLIKKRAQLPVNKDTRERPKIEVEVLKKGEQADDGAKTASDFDLMSTSDKDLVEMAKTDAQVLQKEADKLFAKSEAAMKIANEKNMSARDKKAKANQAALATPIDKQDEAKRNEIAKLRDDAVREKLEAEIAFNLAKEIEASAKNKRKESMDAQEYAVILENALKQDANEEQRIQLQQIRDSLKGIHADAQSTQGDETYNNILKKAKNIELALAKGEEQTKVLKNDLAKIEEQITENNQKQADAKGKEKDVYNDKGLALAAQKSDLKGKLITEEFNLEELKKQKYQIDEEKIVFEEILNQIGTDLADLKTYDDKTVSEIDLKIADFEKNDFDQQNFEDDLVKVEKTPQAIADKNTEKTPTTSIPTKDSSTKSTDSKQASEGPTADNNYKLDLSSFQIEAEGIQGAESDGSTTGAAAEEPPVDVFEEFKTATHSDMYLELLYQAENTPGGENEVRAAKGAIYDEWAQRLDNQAFLLKQKQQKERKESKKLVLQSEIDILETQRDDLRMIANREFSAASKDIRLATGDAGNMDTEQFNEALAAQKIGNVLQSGYHQEYAQDFSAVVDIEDDFSRTYKINSINKQWVNEIDAEIASLQEQKRVAANVQESRIIQERIDNLINFRSNKVNNIKSTETKTANLAKEPFKPSSKSAYSPTFARIDELAVQGRSYYLTALSLRDSAQTLSDETAKEELLQQADLYENRASERILEVAQLTQKANELQNMATAPVVRQGSGKSISPQAPLLASDRGGVALPSTQAKDPAPALDYDLEIPAAEPLPSQTDLDNDIISLEGERNSLVKKLEATTDPTEKAILSFEIAGIDRQTTSKSEIAALLANNTKLTDAAVAKVQDFNLSNNDELTSEKMFAEAAIIYEANKDSMVAIMMLEDQLKETTDANEKRIIEAKISASRKTIEAQAAQADAIFAVAAKVANEESKAFQNRGVREANVALAYPDITKTLNATETELVAESAEYKEYRAANDLAVKAFQQANVLYQNSRNNAMQADKLFKEANSLYFRASQVENTQEKERLIKEAQVLEQRAKTAQSQSEDLKKQAAEAHRNASDMQSKASNLIASQPKEIREAIVAYEKARYSNALPTATPGSGMGDVVADNNRGLTNTTAPNISPSLKATEKSSIQGNEDFIDNFYTGLTTSFYSNENPIPLDPPLPLGIVYKVQIGAFSKPISQTTFSEFAPLSGQKVREDLTRYYAGLFTSYRKASQIKDAIRDKGYSDAFVVAFLNGKRIPYYEAVRLENEVGVTAQIDENYMQQFQEAYNTSGGSARSEGMKVISPAPKPVRSGVIEDYDHLDLKDINGLYYTVQVGVYTKRRSVADLNNLRAIIEIPSGNNFIYSSGIYTEKSVADNAKEQIVKMGFKDAFVTAYINGKRLYAGDAEQLAEEEGPEIKASPWNSFEDKTPEKYSKGGSFPSSVGSPNITSSPTKGSAVVDNQKIVFKVQVGAYKDNIAVEQAKVLLEMTKEGVDIDKSGELTIYRVGNYNDYDKAQNMRLEMIQKGFPDAFIVAFKNNKKMNLPRAIEEYKKQ